jgi:succinate dehydrogenase / fumarate reductase flavoprotein subunit
MEVYKYDLLILGSGLAGLRAAIEACRVSKGKLKIAIISKLQLMRSHSVCAEGGTAGVLREDEGDSLQLHAWDTVKGSDFLADQDVVFRFVSIIPEEIRLLEHWGIPWSRTSEGRIDQRAFGGHSYPRATYAADKTGFFEMHTLYDTLQRYTIYDRYDEIFVTKIFIQDSSFQGVFGYDLKSGKPIIFSAKACILATGGGGRIYGFTTYSHTVTGDGLALAYKEGLPLKDMEFVQFHPTGLVPSGILITEGARGEGGYLLNKNKERFMSHYAEKMMEMAPRDIIARAMMTEILNGRGFKDASGLDYIQLDLTHLGREKLLERLPLVREVGIKYRDIDIIEAPLPVHPVQHYTMGGVSTDINGAVACKGLFAAGEVACISLHGANRLGANSTAECLVWGRITGKQAAHYVLENNPPYPEIPIERIEAERKRVFEGFLSKDGHEDLFQIRKQMRETMDKFVGVFRKEDELKSALEIVNKLKERFKDIKIHDKSAIYNTQLISALELEFMLEIAHVIITAALLRRESRGAHARTDFPKRDDKNFLKHSVAYYTPEGPRIEYKDVNITKWKPVERKY